jgi:hypothetical protein
MAVSITWHNRAHGGCPTWAQALTGIDPALLTPMSTPPENWPLQAAVWRRQLWLRRMVQLKFTRWITFTPALGSLRVGARGRAWLTGRSTPPAPTPEARCRDRRILRGAGAGVQAGDHGDVVDTGRRAGGRQPHRSVQAGVVGQRR